ncbi:MAG TPA: transposase, partial [Pseudothermotoga sp.]
MHVIEIHPSNEQKIILGHLTYSASKLWNVANYEIIEHGIPLSDLQSKLKDKFWAKNLHSQSAQAVLQKLQIAWINCYKKHTKRPRYQPKDGHFPVRWKQNGIKVIRNRIRLSLSKHTKQYLKDKYSIESDYLWIDLPKNLSLNGVQEVEIVPHAIYGHITYVIHIIYRKEINQTNKSGQNIMAIDFGVSNLATIVTNNLTAKIYDGRVLVSKFRLLAKKKAVLQSTMNKSKHKTSRKLHYLIIKERNYVKDYLHKVSTYIVRQAIEEKVGLIAIGNMSYGIVDMDIGAQNNEKLHQIPFGRLREMIEYKAKEYGIQVITISEAYTSQTCSVCSTVDKNN